MSIMDDMWSFNFENVGDSVNQLRATGIEIVDLFLAAFDESNPLLKTVVSLIVMLFSFILVLTVLGFILGTVAIFIGSFFGALITVISFYYVVVENILTLFIGS